MVLILLVITHTYIAFVKFTLNKNYSNGMSKTAIGVNQTSCRLFSKSAPSIMISNYQLIGCNKKSSIIIRNQVRRHFCLALDWSQQTFFEVIIYRESLIKYINSPYNSFNKHLLRSIFDLIGSFIIERMSNEYEEKMYSQSN